MRFPLLPPIPRKWPVLAVDPRPLSTRMQTLLRRFQREALPGLDATVQAGVMIGRASTREPVLLPLPGGPTLAEAEALLPYVQQQLLTRGSVQFPGMTERLTGRGLKDVRVEVQSLPMPFSAAGAWVLSVEMRWSDSVGGVTDAVLRKSQGDVMVARGLAGLEGTRGGHTLRQFLASPVELNPQDLAALASRARDRELFSAQVEHHLAPYLPEEYRIHTVRPPSTPAQKAFVSALLRELKATATPQLHARVLRGRNDMAVVYWVTEPGLTPMVRLQLEQAAASQASQLESARTRGPHLLELPAALTHLEVLGAAEQVCARLIDGDFSQAHVELEGPLAQGPLREALTLHLSWAPPPTLSHDPAFQRWCRGNPDAELLAHVLISADGGEATLERLLFQLEGPVLTAEGFTNWVAANAPREQLPMEAWRVRLQTRLSEHLDAMGMERPPPPAPHRPEFPEPL